MGSRRSEPILCISATPSKHKLQCNSSHRSSYRSSQDLSSAVHHIGSKHPSACEAAVPPEIWKMNCPTTDKPNIAPRPAPPEAAVSPLEVAYIDPYIAIIVKPQGMAVQGGSGHGGDDNLAKSDLLLAVSYR